MVWLTFILWELRMVTSIMQALVVLVILRNLIGQQRNILIDDDYCPRLADFGLVRLAEAGVISGFTATTDPVTMRWTSPQRLQGSTRDPTDDVYSFGCVCYYVSIFPFDFNTYSTMNSPLAAFQLRAISQNTISADDSPCHQR
jgi:serine/threonine protein kinase